ncbi:MAG: hypothetical protein OXN89_20190 [Bryobacterales bacterium]|nr:hypothetical protein [Bryobacterales bacterium]
MPVASVLCAPSISRSFLARVSGRRFDTLDRRDHLVDIWFTPVDGAEATSEYRILSARFGMCAATASAKGLAGAGSALRAVAVPEGEAPGGTVSLLGPGNRAPMLKGRVHP